MATCTGEREIGAVSRRVAMYGTGPKAFQLLQIDYKQLTFKTPFLLEFPLSQPHMYKNTGIIIFTQHSNLWSRNLPNALQKGLLRGLTTLFHLANLQSSHPHEMEACAVIKVPKRINKDRARS